MSALDAFHNSVELLIFVMNRNLLFPLFRKSRHTGQTPKSLLNLMLFTRILLEAFSCDGTLYQRGCSVTSYRIVCDYLTSTTSTSYHNRTRSNAPPSSPPVPSHLRIFLAYCETNKIALCFHLLIGIQRPRSRSVCSE